MVTPPSSSSSSSSSSSTPSNQTLPLTPTVVVKDTRSVAELHELIRLSGLVGERLPKVLLQLAKTSGSGASSSTPDGRGSMVELVEGYKSLYLASIRFNWPINASATVGDAESMKESLRRVGEFLQVEIHDVLMKLKNNCRV
jgi:hypothetical protein